MNLLLLSSVAGAAAAALVDDINCRQHRPPTPSVSSSGGVQCSSEVEAGGVVLLSKRSALSKAVFKHEAADIEGGEEANHTLGGVNDRFSRVIGALSNMPSSLLFIMAKPAASTATIARRSITALWFLLLLACGLVLALLVFQLRKSQRKHDIYDDDDNTQEDGWKHEGWVKRNHYGKDQTDRDKLLAAALARGERPTYSRDDGGLVYQDAWMKESAGSQASSSNQPRQEALIAPSGAIGGKLSGQAEKFVEKRGEFALAAAAGAGDAALGIGKDIQGRTGKVAKRLDKATGKTLTKFTGAVDTAANRVAMRWDEARAGNSYKKY